MNVLAQAQVPFVDAWSSDPGLKVEIRPDGLWAAGEATSAEGVLGVRLDGLQVEVALRPQLSAPLALGLLRRGLPAFLDLQIIPGPKGAQLLYQGPR